VAMVVTVIARNRDLAFYPAYFSQDIPNGVDMALEYEGSTLSQSRSAFGGSCGGPWKEVKIRADHRQVPVYIQGRWISVNRKLASPKSTKKRVAGRYLNFGNGEEVSDIKGGAARVLLTSLLRFIKRLSDRLGCGRKTQVLSSDDVRSVLRPA